MPTREKTFHLVHLCSHLPYMSSSVSFILSASVLPVELSVHLPPCFSSSLITVQEAVIPKDSVWVCTLMRLYLSHQMLLEGSESTLQGEYWELLGQDVSPSKPKEIVPLRLSG
jgi:hypothetical protein